MNRELLTTTLGLVRDLASGETCALTVEQAGVLQAFLDIRSKQTSVSVSEKALHRKVKDVLAHWHSNPESVPKAPIKPGEDRRTQLALREAIDKVLQERWDEITGDEIRIVRATHAIVQKRQSTTSAAGQDRLQQLLDTVVQRLDEYEKASVTPPPSVEEDESVFTDTDDEDSPVIRRRCETLTADEAFQGRQRIPVSTIEGIEVDVSLRTFEFPGDVVIEGDIPRDVLLIASNGGVLAKGFVAGNIVASGNITVEGNVQGGVLVSRSGNISLDRVLVKSIVVAKAGDIECNDLEDPERVFAWGTITIHGTMMGGAVFAAHILSSGAVISGELHSCGDITVASVEVGNRTPPVICLRKTLTCADYGRRMDRSVQERQRRVFQLEKEIESLVDGNGYTLRLIRYCYRTGVYYLIGGAQCATAVLEMQGLETRSLYLKLIISIASRVSEQYAAATGQEIEPSDLQRMEEESLQLLKYLREDIKNLPDELGGGHRHYLFDRCQRLQNLFTELNATYLTAQDGARKAQLEFAQALDDWGRVARDCDREAERIKAKLAIDPKILSVIESDPDALPALLEECIERELRGDGDPKLKRVISPLIRVLKGQADRYKRNASTVLKKIETTKEELESLRGVLATDSAVLFGNSVVDDCTVSAERYAKGVVLTAGIINRNGGYTDAPGVIVLAESIDRTTKFRLRGEEIQRVF